MTRNDLMELTPGLGYVLAYGRRLAGADDARRSVNLMLMDFLSLHQTRIFGPCSKTTRAPPERRGCFNEIARGELQPLPSFAACSQRWSVLAFCLHQGASSRGLGQLITTHKHVSRNFQPFGQPANHFERQRPHSIEHFGHARTRSDVGLKVLSR